MKTSPVDPDQLQNTLILSGGYWTYADPDERRSPAVKFDKVVRDELPAVIKKSRPKTSIFSGQSIRDLLLPHAKNKYILHLDIQEYYKNIKFSHVKDVLAAGNPGFDAAILRVVEKFYFDPELGLRRGLRAAPALSEIVGLKIDNQIARLLYAEKDFTKISYSRYYDDLFFSSDNPLLLRRLEKQLKDVLSGLGFTPNREKTKLFLSDNAKILGLRISNHDVTVSKRFRRELRPKIRRFDELYAVCDWTDENAILELLKQTHVVLGSLQFLVANLSGEKSRNKYQNLITEFQKRQGEITKKLNAVSANNDVFDDDYRLEIL